MKRRAESEERRCGNEVGRHLEQGGGKFARERDKKYISCGRLNANETAIRDSQEEGDTLAWRGGGATW